MAEEGSCCPAGITAALEDEVEEVEEEGGEGSLRVCCVSSAPRGAAAFHTAGRGGARSGALRSAHCGGAAAAAAAATGALASPAALRAPSVRQGAPRGRHGCGEGEAGEQHHHGRGRVLQVRGAHADQEGQGGGGHGARPGPARHQRVPEGRLRGRHRRARLRAQLRPGVDRQPCRLRAGQVPLVPAAQRAAGRAAGLHPGAAVRAAQLHPHLAADAAAAGPPDAAAAAAAAVEEPDGPGCDAALPEHGQGPVVHPGEDDRRLKWMSAVSTEEEEQALQTGNKQRK